MKPIHSKLEEWQGFLLLFIGAGSILVLFNWRTLWLYALLFYTVSVSIGLDGLFLYQKKQLNGSIRQLLQAFLLFLFTTLWFLTILL